MGLFSRKKVLDLPIVFEAGSETYIIILAERTISTEIGKHAAVERALSLDGRGYWFRTQHTVGGVLGGMQMYRELLTAQDGRVLYSWQYRTTKPLGIGGIFESGRRGFAGKFIK